MLKLLSVNMYEIEGNSRIERLTEFKKAYGAAIKAISQSFVKSFPERGERGAESFVYSFFPFLFGIYPYTNATEKQKAAMEAAGVKYAGVFRVRSRVQRGHKIVAIKNLYKGEETLWTKKFW